MTPKTLSGAEFKAYFTDFLRDLNDDDEIFFGSGDLSFYRIKDRGAKTGPRLIGIEFAEVYSVTVDPEEPD